MSLRRATVATISGGLWPKQLPIFELLGTQYATHLRSPPHLVLPLPLVALCALSDETAPPPQSHLLHKTSAWAYSGRAGG